MGGAGGGGRNAASAVCVRGVCVVCVCVCACVCVCVCVCAMYPMCMESVHVYGEYTCIWRLCMYSIGMCTCMYIHMYAHTEAHTHEYIHAMAAKPGFGVSFAL